MMSMVLKMSSADEIKTLRVGGSPHVGRSSGANKSVRMREINPQMLAKIAGFLRGSLGSRLW